MTGLGEPERLQGARVSWNYFDVLGAGMAHGRAFVEADSQGDGRLIVLSHGLWRRRFGGRADVINSTTTLDGRAVTIVGVGSADLNFPSTAEFWQPLIFTARDLSSEARGAQWVQVLARLKIGVSAQLAKGYRIASATLLNIDNSRAWLLIAGMMLAPMIAARLLF